MKNSFWTVPLKRWYLGQDTEKKFGLYQNTLAASPWKCLQGKEYREKKSSLVAGLRRYQVRL
jgi:hypothetical protein